MMPIYTLLGILNSERGLWFPLSELFPLFGAALTSLNFHWLGYVAFCKLLPMTYDNPIAMESSANFNSLELMLSGPHDFPGFTLLSMAF